MRRGEAPAHDVYRPTSQKNDASDLPETAGVSRERVRVGCAASPARSGAAHVTCPDDDENMHFM